MTNRQFNFSVTVGVALAALGSVILSKATVGFSLIALGAAIAALALLTRATNRRSAREAPVPERVRHFHDSVSDY